ncbi:MAG: DUF924 family protein [Moraxella sp.]|nr:DUF924 family protein [Moraxella sp.]
MIYTLDPTANDVLNFWFDPNHKPFWFVKSDDFDDKIRQKFAHLIPKAVAGELWDWRADHYGRLAEILVLDQFTRNVHRSTPSAFIGDDVALILAQEAIGRAEFADLPKDFQTFIAMPFMHTENLAIHEWAVEIFGRIGDAVVLDYEHRHKAIIERFGRYPHRNAILGRASTPDEMVFLKQPNSSF